MTQNILVVIDQAGEVEAVLGDEITDLKVHYIDYRQIRDDQNEWYARDTLVEAEKYPAHWKNMIDLEELVAMVETAGLEPPAWLLERRNERLLKSLADLESL